MGIFIILYGVFSVYFAGVMVRLMLVLAPVMCILGGIAVSSSLSTYMKYLDSEKTSQVPTRQQGGGGGGKQNRARQGDSSAYPGKETVAMFFIGMMTFFLITYVFHCTWVTSEAYSSPSIVLSARSHDGSRIIFDDFREAYWWLRMNTAEDAKVASWWDYGYQTTAMANRTVIVDNNTWNNTHIATVGTAMSSPERQAWEIFESLDVKYVLVVFGGLVGYPSDDINKFLWMVRIGGGVFPHIKEPDYLRD